MNYIINLIVRKIFYIYLLMFLGLNLAMLVYVNGIHASYILNLIDSVTTYVTNMLWITSIVTTTVYVVPKFRKFYWRYLFVSAFTLAWIVFIGRLSFDIFSGIGWAEKMRLAVFPSMPADWYKFFDAFLHYIPLFTFYAILYHGFDEFLETWIKRSKLKLLLCVAIPLIVLFLWNLTSNPHATYFLSTGLITYIFIYGFPLFATSYIYFFVSGYIATSGKIQLVMSRYLLNMFSFYLLVINIGVGIYIFGYNACYERITVFASIITCVFLMLRYLHCFRKIRKQVLKLFLLPLSGFIIGIVFLREIFLIYYSGRHIIFLINLRVGSYANQLYAWYMVTFIVVMFQIYGDIIFKEFPYKTNMLGSQRKFFRMRQINFIMALWQSYGGIVFAFAYLLINRFNIPYFSINMLSRDFLLALLVFVFICFATTRQIYESNYKFFIK